MARIYTGTFYIVDDKIVYTLDTDEENAIDHYQLWDLVVPKLFPHVPFEDREELKEGAVYGADRGRVVFKGQKSKTGAFQSGTFSLYGTPDCKQHEAKLKEIFGLKQIEKLPQFDLEVDFHSDPHYKVQTRDKKLLDDFLRASKFDKTPLKIAGTPKVQPSEKSVKISST
jgi:hypothetical protein